MGFLPQFSWRDNFVDWLGIDVLESGGTFVRNLDHGKFDSARIGPPSVVSNKFSRVSKQTQSCYSRFAVNKVGKRFSYPGCHLLPK